MAEKNSTLAARAWLSQSNDFQQRIPDPTVAGVGAMLDALFDPMNQQYYNEWATFMVNQYGTMYTRQQRFKNPLKEFKKGAAMYGNTIIEQQLGWIKAHTYNIDAEVQFKNYFPDGLQAFHSVNDKRRYDISVSRENLYQAVNGAGDGGTELNDTVSAIMAQPMNANEYDEMDLMLNLFGEADERYGLFREHLDSSPLTHDGGEELLVKLRQYAVDLTVPTTGYACVDMPAFVNPEELVLFVPSDVQASVDVRNLAVVFALEKADIPYRIKKIAKKKWPLKETDRCILTTGDFFQCYNKLLQNTSQWDPAGLKTNYFLHSWNTWSFSPFVPVIVFSEDAGTELPTVTVTPKKLTLTAESKTAAPGATVQLTTEISGTVDPETEGISVAPNAAVFDIACTRTTGETTEAVQLNTKTYVDRLNKLHIQRSGLKTGDVINIAAVSCYRNPGGETTPLTASATITIE